ncbi:MAG TPA: hypothetical protein VFG87_25255 [Amycolatopsis sp.]|jgi:hypothetical protein|nr:hypothetical protein [Amycolatopsis sp.]
MDQPAPTYSDRLRKIAAMAAQSELRHRAMGELIDELEAKGLTMTEFREMNERAGRFIGHVSAVNAAQAIAYDDMLAAGGPENSRAYVEYEATSRRNAALLPQEI